MSGERKLLRWGDTTPIVRFQCWIGRFERLPVWDWLLRTRDNLPWLGFLAFYIILANLPYWFVAREFAFVRLGCFCVQYLTAGVIALIFPRAIAVVFLAGVMLADFLCGVTLTYGVPIRECLDNVRNALDAFKGLQLVYGIAAALLTVLALAIAFLLPGARMRKDHRWYAATCLVIFAAISLCSDSLAIREQTGHLPNPFQSSPRQDWIRSNQSTLPRLSRLPVIRLFRIEFSENEIQRFERRGPASRFPVPSATDVGLRESKVFQSGNAQLPNIVQILVESWGVSTNSALRTEIVTPYLDPKVEAKYKVIQGSVSFYGPTISAEARELCDSGIGFHLLTATPSELRDCLPARLGGLGYESIGVHGMNGQMFNRSVWYRVIGFQERWFHEQLRQEGLRDCAGAFAGTCDGDIADWIGERLDQASAQPKFIHWMTLNSHLPEPVPASLSDGASCIAALGLEPDSPLCSWYQLIHNVHRSVSKMALSSLSRPSIFVIVGDHAPPFGDPALCAMFSQTEVPYVLLIPRSRPEISKSLMARSQPLQMVGKSRPAHTSQ